MIAQAARIGHSFKGAFAYYLHDKRQNTAERVAWSEVRNLAHDDPAYVQSVMIATARSAEALKTAAGVKATGRKATAGPVFAYSLAWQPEKETPPDRAEMMRAVEASLKALKAEHLQASIICHTDTKHPHVHVILNRVNPETGRTDTKDEWRLLRKFREDYEKQRGEIVTKTREERLAGYGQWRREKSADHFAKAAQPEAAIPKPKTAAAKLAEEQAAMKVRHQQEWASLSANNKARRAAVYAERIDFKAIAADHRAATRPYWSKLGKEQAAERRAFLAREKRVSGIVANAIEAARSQQRRGVADDRGFLTMAVGYTLSAKARRAAFDARQKDRKDELAATLGRTLTAKFDAIKSGQGVKLAAVRDTYDRERAALIQKQDREKAQIRDGWRKIYDEREKLAQHADRSRDRMTQQGPQNFRHGRRLDRGTRPQSGGLVPRPDRAQPEATAAAPAAAVPIVSEFDAAAQLAPVNELPDLARDFSERVRQPIRTPAEEAAARQAKTAGQIRNAWAAAKAARLAEQGPQQEQEKTETRERRKGRERTRVRTRGGEPS